MTTIKIVTDSTCDLPKEVLEKHGIEIVPLSITFGDKTYLDGIDITKEEFMDKLKSSDDLPKSSQPSAGAFQEVYNRLNKEADDVKIISIHITDSLSGTTYAAQTAADMCDADVRVINSHYTSQALGFQVVKAAELAEEGQAVDEIVMSLEEIRQATSLYIMVDTLEYLAKGGRIGKSKAFLGSLLKIKPIAVFTDGVLNPVTKVRTHLQMIQQLTTTFTNETKGKIVKRIGISHADAESVATKLKQSLQEVTDVKDITIQVTSPIISTHTGPGAIALMYYAESK